VTSLGHSPVSYMVLISFVNVFQPTWAHLHVHHLLKRHTPLKIKMMGKVQKKKTVSFSHVIPSEPHRVELNNYLYTHTVLQSSWFFASPHLLTPCYMNCWHITKTTNQTVDYHHYTPKSKTVKRQKMLEKGTGWSSGFRNNYSLHVMGSNCIELIK
jgi:hypothetical protein